MPKQTISLQHFLKTGYWNLWSIINLEIDTIDAIFFSKSFMLNANMYFHHVTVQNCTSKTKAALQHTKCKMCES